MEPEPQELSISRKGESWMAVFTALVMVVTGTLIAYGGYQERRNFVQTQMLVADAKATSIAGQVSTLLHRQQRIVKHYVQDNMEIFDRAMAGTPDDTAVLSELTQSLRRKLPALSTLLLINRGEKGGHAKTAGAFDDEFMQQLRQLILDNPGKPVLLTGVEGRNYYAITSSTRKDQRGLVIALIGTAPVTELLHRGQIIGQFLMLYGRDITAKPLVPPGSQEVFSPLELSLGEYSVDIVISGTGWKLIVIPDPGVLRANLFQIILLRILIISLMLLSMLSIYLYFRQRERLLEVSRRQLLGANRQLHYQSMHDALTGLPNRALLEEKIKAKISDSFRSGERFILMLISLNEFQRINRNLGYDIGNEVLRQIAFRLSETLRDVDSVGRFEGDVFAVLADIKEKPQASVIAGKVVDCLDQSIDVGESPLSVSASIGAVICPDQGKDLDTLLRNADRAVGLAKSNSGQSVVFSNEDEEIGMDRLSIITGLRDAIGSGQLQMVFQPKLSLTAPEERSFEALLRWEHPEYGQLPCDMFIPLIEQTKHISDLTHWTIESCFQTLRKMRHQYGRSSSVAINLSARVLDEEGFPERVEQMLNHYDLESNSVRFEITESAMMNDSDRAMQIMLRLAAMGISLSVDDFGVGHSSLAYISRLPVDELKVDKSFVLSMQKWESDRAIVKATIDLAHDLGLSVVAEGVETLEQATMLREMECDVLQGYYVSRPLNEEQVLKWLSSKAD